MSTDQFTQLMEAITASHSHMDAKFVEFQAEIRQGQEEATAKSLNRVKYEKPYSFKKKGNEEQAVFNSKVEETLAEAKEQITDAGSTASPVLQGARDAINKGQQLLAERQKLIKIADRSWSLGGAW